MLNTDVSKPPPSLAGEFANSLPSVWEAYGALGGACAKAGPLEPQTQRLVKQALAMGAGSRAPFILTCAAD